jgi:hypothetical protein
MVNNIVAKAYGARFAQRRVPDEEWQKSATLVCY